MLEHLEGRLAQTRGLDAPAAGAGQGGQGPSRRTGQRLAAAPTRRQEGGRRGVRLLGQGQGEVGGGDFGVTGGLGLALGEGERLSGLRGGLQLHGIEGLLSTWVGKLTFLGVNRGKVASIPLNFVLRGHQPNG